MKPAKSGLFLVKYTCFKQIVHKCAIVNREKLCYNNKKEAFMEGKDIIAICILGTMGILLYAIGILMLCGKGGILVAGYHYEPKTERAKKYHKKVMQIIGLWYLALITSMFVLIVSAILSQKVVAIISGVLMGLIMIGALVYLNCNPKMLELRRKERDDYTEEVRVHESEDNYEVHESEDNIEYHNCPTAEESSEQIIEEMTASSKSGKGEDVKNK